MEKRPHRTLNYHPLCYCDMSEAEFKTFMKITRTHPFTGVTNTLDLNITSEEWERYLNGELVQNAMPHLNEDEREFIISGIPPGEWDKWLPSDEE